MQGNGEEVYMRVLPGFEAKGNPDKGNSHIYFFILPKSLIARL